MILARLGLGPRRTQAPAPEAAPPFSARIDPPRFLFLQVNKRCNLRCVHCAFWQDDDSDKANYLGRAEKRRLIGEFAGLNARGAVVVCGGESMLDLEDYFDISGACRALGLTCISVVNGTRIRSSAMAERITGQTLVVDGGAIIRDLWGMHEKILAQFKTGDY